MGASTLFKLFLITLNFQGLHPGEPLPSKLCADTKLAAAKAGVRTTMKGLDRETSFAEEHVELFSNGCDDGGMEIWYRFVENIGNCK